MVKLLLILDKRTLNSQCLAFGISLHRSDLKVLTASSIDQFSSIDALSFPLAAVVSNIGTRRLTEDDCADDLRQMCGRFQVPIVVLANSAAPEDAIIALQCGAKGYIPLSVSLKICVEAIGLAVAGGIFIPAESLIASREPAPANEHPTPPWTALFTKRQSQVAEVLRRGIPNKVIAHELDMRESTVKVHTRNIMKKLRVGNRTEAAFKLNAFCPPPPEDTDAEK